MFILFCWVFDMKTCLLKNDFVLAQYSQQTGGPVELSKRSRPAEVKMWLEHMDFSKM